MTISFKTEVQADNSGTWAGNALRFATKAEAEQYVADLSMRWTAVRETRVVESDDPVNYAFVDGKAVDAVEVTKAAPTKAKRKPRGDTIAKGPSKGEAQAATAADGQVVAVMPKAVKAAAAKFGKAVAKGKPAKVTVAQLEKAVEPTPTKAPRQRSGVHYEVRKLLCTDLSMASRPAEVVAALGKDGLEITEQALVTVLVHWRAAVAALQEAGLLQTTGTRH